MDSYSLRYRLSSETAWNNETGITGTTYEISGLTSNSEYEIQIQSINTEGMSGWVPDPPLTATTSEDVSEVEVPTPPRRLQAVSGDTGVIITWLEPAVEGAGGATTGYNLWRNDGDSWTEIEADTGNTDLTYTDTDTLVEGQQYSYVMRAINASGFSDWSAGVNVVINTSSSSAPLRFNADSQSSGVVMSWTAPADDGNWRCSHGL